MGRFPVQIAHTRRRDPDACPRPGSGVCREIGAIDTTSYLVLNHDRPAGEMLVISSEDSVVVKYHHVDRNRSARWETHYIVRQGRVIGGRTWNIPLNATTPVLGEP